MVTDILRSAEAQGVHVYQQSGKLHFVARRGAMTDELRQRLKANKALIIEHLSTSDRRSPRPPSEASTSGAGPLSCAQERIWLLDRLEGGSAAYNMPAAFRVSGALDVRALEDGFAALLERHAVLRTKIVERDGKLTQQLDANAHLTLHEVDLSQLPSARATEEANRLQAHEARRPFDLTSDLPLRVTLARLSAEEQILLVTLHHVACDGWSIDTLIAELGKLYDAHTRGQQPDLPPQKLKYLDYARWQRSWLAGPQAEQQLEYWTQRLQQLAPLHGLPLDAGRTRAKKGLGLIHAQRLDLPLQQAAAESARQAGTTLFVFLHAAFVALLSRYGNTTDIAIGTPTAGRVHLDTEPLIGNFVNTLVLRSNLDDNPDFVALLRQTQRVALEALQNQQLPFEKLVEHVARDRPRHANPLFQIMFALHEFENRKLELGNSRVTRLEPAPTEAKLDLELHVFRGEDTQLQLSWVYDAELFQPQTIRRLADGYHAILEQVVREPHTRVLDLALGSRARATELLAQAAGVTRDVPALPTHRLVEQQAQQTPAAVALEFLGQHLSYRDLERRANRLAHRLLTAGVGPGQLVGVGVRRSFDLLVGLLAIWKAGAAYVPLDPEQPSARVVEILTDANITHVVTHRAVSGRFLGLEVELIRVDDDDGAGDDVPAPEVATSVDDVAYVLYTSGSTGRPKGAVISHRGLVNYLDHAARSYLRGEVVGSVVSSPLSFDATITTLFAPLLTGARVTLLPDEDNAAVLTRLAEQLFLQETPRLFKITPAHLDVLATPARAPNAAARHVIVIGGEQLTAHTLATWRAHLLPASTFINEYGPTETVVGCSVYELAPGHDPARTQEGAIPIGRPIQNTQLHVLASGASRVGEAALQPTGATGELYIGGAGVALEYLNRAQLSAERFVPDPFSKTPGARLYRTGDLVRRRADGELEFLGRTDHQLKLRGYRIEPGELEARLRDLPAIRDAAVLLRRDGAGESYLVGYVVPRHADVARQAELAAECRAQLKQSVPDYMVPSAFVCLRELPLTPNGKLARNALPEPADSDFHRAAYVAPCDDREALLCELWSQILGVERISADDDFFQLGGTSLGATRLVALVRARLDTDVSLRDVFERPSVRAFAGLLSARAATAPSPTSSLDLGQAGPLSFAQQRLRFIDQFEGESTHYGMFGAFELSGRLDRAALRRAVDQLVAQHESLRTVFPRLEGAPEQRVGQLVRSSWSTPITELDLSARDAPSLDEELARVARAEADRRFDLTQDAMLRVTLVICSERRWLLLVNIHHIAADGWSLGVLSKDFSRAYSAYAQGLEVELPRPSLRYLAFAHQQREASLQARFERDVSYWQQQLADLPPVHGLPLRGPRPPQQGHAGASLCQRLPAALTQAWRELCREHDVTLFMGLQTAFAVLVARYGNSHDVVVGTAMSGREYPGSERTVGLFVNMLVLRSDLSKNPAFDALLAISKATILDAYEHQGVPFDVLVERLRPERKLSYDPLVQIVLTLQDNDRSPLQLTGLRVEPRRFEETRVKFDLQLDVEILGDELELRWLYRTDLFEPDFVQRLASSFETLLRGVIADPRKRSLELPLLHPAERARLLAPLHDARPDTPDGCLHDYFEAQARRHPARVAVRQGQQHWTYDELNQRSNRLAHYLVREGVGPESLVGLCVEPSLDTLVAILGILKAGGAYVPIAPDQPEFRLDYILRDAGVEIVLTQAAFAAKLQPDQRRVVCLDSVDYQAASADSSVENLPRGATRPRADNAAYVIYTSGSTGEPKGVCVEHRNVLSLLGAANEHFRFSEDDVWTLFHSSAFDFSVWEIWGALFHGGCVVVLPVATTKDPERLALLLQQEHVTVLNQTPQAFYKLEEAMTRTGCQHHLRYVVFGGEALDYSQLRRWYDAYGDRTQLVNMYGITETTVHVTFAPISPGDVGSTASGIGRPLSSLVGLVCNERQELQPIGCAGELLVAGAGVARGYLHRPELSAQRFVVLPQYGEQRFYRTGDLVKRSEAGTLDYLGRIDAQLKIRGFRIEPGEIEKHLGALGSVKHCVVVARDDAAHGKTLIAYVVPRTETAEADEQIAACRAHLQARLPSYMVPSTFVLLGALPTTSNGKVDYRALPAAGEPLARPARASQPPRDELESKLAEAWRAVLGLPKVGIDDNFFEVGGHSLATITLTTLLKRQFQLDIPVAELFRHQTIRSLSDALGSGTLQRDNLALLLKVRGAKPPLFFLPPATGVGHCFMGLSASLPSDRAHYAFMTPGQETGDELPESVESLARRYLDYIRTYHGVLSHWYLAGYSVGGVVAYEIGRQCLASGYPTPHLIMLDSYLPRHKPLVPLRPAQILYDVYGDDATRYLTTAKHLVKLFFEYRPQPAPLSVTVFKATGSSPLIYNNRRNWRRFALAGVEVLPVSGGHRTLLAPENLPVLARAFEKCFEANDRK